MLVQHFLEDTARRIPDKVALVCAEERITYRDLDLMADRLASALRDLSVRRSDRVVIYLRNSVAAVVAIFATLKADAVFVFVNRTTKPDKLRFILNNCRAAALITDARAFDEELAAKYAGNVPSLRAMVVCGGSDNRIGDVIVRGYASIQADPSPSRSCPRNIDLDLACLIYTSGTTGEPKGVMCDHSNMIFVSAAVIEYLKNVEEDVLLNALPLSFSYGLYQVLMTFRFGGTLVLENSFAYPETILRMIAAERVTGFPGVPAMFAMLLRMDLSRFDVSSLRYVTNAAAALPPAQVLEFRRRLPDVALFSMHGLTETKRTLYLPPELLEQKPGSVGVAIPGTEVWIEDESGRRLGPDEVGELVVRGRHVMRGYWESPAETAARFRPGPIPGERLCYTGDLFRMDRDGHFYFVSRKDEIIKSRGEKVVPKEIEDALLKLPGVAEAAVVGVPDPILGQAIKAIIVRARPDLSTGEVLAFCRAQLEDFMVPQLVEFRDSFLKSPSGKIRKGELV